MFSQSEDAVREIAIGCLIENNYFPNGVSRRGGMKLGVEIVELEMKCELLALYRLESRCLESVKDLSAFADCPPGQVSIYFK